MPHQTTAFSSTQHVAVVVEQPKSSPPPQNVKEWSDGLCGCFNDCCTCLTGWLCLPFLACHVARKMGENCFCVGLVCAPTSWVALRTKLRTLYGIKGSITKDFLAVCCCPCLSIAQMNRQLKKIESHPV